MAFRILGGMIVLAAIWFSGSGPALPLRGDECAQVSGGCTVTAYADCAYATNTKVNPCSACSTSRRDCTSSHVNEACTPLTNTAAEDCISCGTCDEDCGGTARIWDGGADGMGCDGTFTTASCGRTYKDAQNGECDVACPAE